MSTVQIASDLHLEFFGSDLYEIRKFLKTLKTNADILLLAGDTFNITYLDIQMDCISNIFNNTKVIFIPGNHEYYYSNKEKMENLLMKKSEKYNNITFLENDYIFIDDKTVIIGACGWNDKFNSLGAKMMNDFVLIKDLSQNKYKSMTWNNISKEFFKMSFKKFQDKKIICVTHNSPLLDFIPSKYLGSNLNSFFANDWSDIIQMFKPDVWVSGHYHQFKKFEKFETLFIENGFGYFKHDQVKDFNNKLIINI